MKKKLDKIDIEILTYLDRDSRQPVKQIADAMKKKISTIYHRISRLNDQKIITGYYVSLNPEYLNIEKMNAVRIFLKKTLIPKFNEKFLSSFGQFLCTENPDIAFLASEQNGESLLTICVHPDESSETKFIKKIKDNPYVNSIEIFPLSKIMKGDRLFQFSDYFYQPEDIIQSPEEKAKEDDQNTQDLEQGSEEMEKITEEDLDSLKLDEEK